MNHFLHYPAFVYEQAAFLTRDLVTLTHAGQLPAQVTHTLGNIFGGGVFPGLQTHRSFKKVQYADIKERDGRGRGPAAPSGDSPRGTVAGLDSRTQITGLAAR